MSKRKAFLTYTHALKYFSFFTKKEILANVFSCPIFPRLFSLMPLPSGHFLHMRMLNRFIFLSPLSSHHVQNSCPNIYCLTMLCIPARIFPSRPYTLCVPFAKVHLYREWRRQKISNLSLRSTDLSTSQTIYPFFAYFSPSFFSACPVQRKISNYFFSKRMLFHPRIFKIK